MSIIECLKKDFALISKSNKSTLNISEVVFPIVYIMPKSRSLILSIIQEVQLNVANALEALFLKYIC